MQPRRRLRSRIFVSFAVFGIALTAMFAVSTIYLRGRLESQIIGKSLEANLNGYADSFYKNPRLQGVPFEKIQGWTFSSRHFANVPLPWYNLPNGVHDLTEPDGKGGRLVYKLAVRKDPDYWFFLKYDTSQEQRSQVRLEYAMIGAVAVFALFSVLIGAWLSTRVIRPVTELAARLRAARQSGTPQPLAPYFAEDEVGELAAALDDYAQRQSAMVERDREFNADVSHELRTPLAVIATTTELLLDNPELPDKVKTRLKRIERAVRQSTELTQALLLLSRAERSGPVDGETTDVAKIAAEAIDTNRQHLGNKPVTMRLEIESPCEVEAPSSVVAVALGNLVGNACKYTLEGEVVVRVQEGRVLVEDTGPGIEAEDVERLFERGVRGEGQTVKGAGLGLAIVRRLCELYGWRVSLAPHAEHGAVATLDFQKR